MPPRGHARTLSPSFTVFVPVAHRPQARVTLRTCRHVFMPQPPRRAATPRWSMQSSSSSSCRTAGCGCSSHIAEVPKELNVGPLLVPFQKLLDLRKSLRAALLSLGVVVLCAALRFFGASVLVTNVLISIPVVLTLFPAVLASLLELYQSRMAATNVGVLMSSAATISVCTGFVLEGAFLATLYALSFAGEIAITGHAAKELSNLREMTPEFAYRVRYLGLYDKVPVCEILVGDRVWVKAGEMVPCDGVVADGTQGAFISAPHLTGESTPRAVEPGDEVPAGARTVDAPLVVRVTRVGAESSLARIERLVNDAESNRPSFLSLYDRFGRLYARSVLIIAALLAAFLPAVRPSVPFTGENGSLKRSLGFLVVTSPCALVIGAPVAYVAALSACARRGVLVKSGAKAIERAARSNSVVFDKTGTLTSGKLAWVGCTRLDGDRWVDVTGAELGEAIGVAAALERGAVHPVAEAILKKADELRVPVLFSHGVQTVPGQGVEGYVGDAPARIGRRGFATTSQVEKIVELEALGASARGETVSVLQYDGRHYMVRLRDAVREESRGTVTQLRKGGNKVVVLTGDAAGAAESVAREVGEVKVVAEATPASKLEFMQHATIEAGRKGRSAVMVGDGVNDAPALAAAHVGVACGLTSATAVHAADVVLVKEGVRDVAWFLELSRRTERVVLQNMVVAIGLMIAAAGPVVHGSLPLWIAVLMHEGGTLLVGLNGLRLLRGSKADK